MSCERKVYTFEEVEEVRIECCDKKEIEALEKTIISALEQKVEKLNVLIKNCNIYSYGGVILVNDRYNICSDLVSVAEALGMTITPIQCFLRGKNYIVTDELLSFLTQIGVSFEFGKSIANQDLDETAKEIIVKNLPKRAVDPSILAMVENIKLNGQYVTTRKRTVSEEYEEGYGNRAFIGRSEGEWTSDADEIRGRLIELSKGAQTTVNRTNAQLRDGTARLIYARARQMGYAVQEVKKGTQTQLVLVRCE